MAQAKRDANRIATLIGVSSTDSTIPILAEINSTTGRLLVDALTSPSLSKDLIGGGKISVGTTAVEMTFASATESIIITADKDNTGLIFIGKSNVTNLGANAFVPLNASEALIIEFDDASNGIFAVSDTVSQNIWKGALI